MLLYACNSTYYLNVSMIHYERKILLLREAEYNHQGMIPLVPEIRVSKTVIRPIPEIAAHVVSPITMPTKWSIIVGWSFLCQLFCKVINLLI